MDKLRSRRPTFKGQPSTEAKVTREDFKPDVQWFEDPSERKLIMQLTGFKREEIRVTLDAAGKLLVKGSRQVSDNKYLDVDQTFDIPKDTIIEKISGKFEDGSLALTLPKRVVEKHEPTPEATTEEKKKESIQEEKKEEGVTQKETQTTKKEKDEPAREKESIQAEKKEEEAAQKQAKADKEEKDEAIEEKPASLEERKDEQMPGGKPKAVEEKLSELTGKEKPKPKDDKKEEGPVLKEKLENGEEKKDEPAEKEKSESFKEKKEDSIQKETVMPSSMEKEREQKTIQKMKSKIMEICADKPKEIIKRISIWRGGEDGRLDSGSVDGILEKLNRNRKVIAVAIAAFSVGFYVSQKLRTNGR